MHRVPEEGGLKYFLWAALNDILGLFGLSLVGRMERLPNREWAKPKYRIERIV